MSNEIHISNAEVQAAAKRQAKAAREIADFLKTPNNPIADMINSAMAGLGETDFIDRLADKAEAEASALEDFIK